MNSPQATVVLKSPDGAWTTVGTETSRGIVAEGITLTANESGPDTCSFSLRREASVPYPDLLSFNQADVVIGGSLVWGGRIWEAPLSDADEDVIAVAGRGWQYHLDDDLLRRCYVLTDLTQFVDMRSKPTAVLAPGALPIGPQIQAGSGTVVLVYPNAYPVTISDSVGVVLDLGAPFIERVVVTWENLIADGNVSFYVRTSDNEYVHQAGVPIDDASAVRSMAAGTITTTTLTPAAPRRYLHLFMYRSGASGVYGSDSGVRISAVKVFSSTAYESVNASVLKASQVAADVLGSGAVPLLDSSTAKIETTAFSIPELAPSGYQTPRALIAAANAYEGNLFGVDAERRLFLRERDTFPKVEVGAWPGSSFQDASTNSGDGLYNKVIVQGTGPDGAALSAARYSSDVASAPSSAFADVSGFPNPGFETDTSGWTASIGALDRVTVADPNGPVFIVGSAGGRLTSQVSPENGSVSTTLSNLTVGAIHTVSFQYRRAFILVPLYLTAEVTSGGTVLGSVVDDSSPPAGVWAQPRVSFVATATTATLTISASVVYSTGALFLIYLDDVRVYKVAASLLDRQGFVRTAVLSVESALTASGATQLGDIWLNERVHPPLKGSLVVSQGGARYLNGGDVHPSEMLLRYGQKIRLGQLVDPTTGEQGRDGTIKSVSYSHDTETASLELDSERGRLETLLSRLSVVTSQIRG